LENLLRWSFFTFCFGGVVQKWSVIWADVAYFLLLIKPFAFISIWLVFSEVREIALLNALLRQFLLPLRISNDICMVGIKFWLVQCRLVVHTCSERAVYWVDFTCSNNRQVHFSIKQTSSISLDRCYWLQPWMTTLIRKLSFIPLAGLNHAWSGRGGWGVQGIRLNPLNQNS